jgi:hypothetical protein
MPITPSKTAENTWDIKICVKVDGELRCINEVFVGSIKEAMIREKQLHDAAKKGSVELNRFFSNKGNKNLHLNL